MNKITKEQYENALKRIEVLFRDQVKITRKILEKAKMS